LIGTRFIATGRVRQASAPAALPKDFDETFGEDVQEVRDNSRRVKRRLGKVVYSS